MFNVSVTITSAADAAKATAVFAAIRQTLGGFELPEHGAAVLRQHAADLAEKREATGLAEKVAAAIEAARAERAATVQAEADPLAEAVAEVEQFVQDARADMGEQAGVAQAEADMLAEADARETMVCPAPAAPARKRGRPAKAAAPVAEVAPAAEPEPAPEPAPVAEVAPAAEPAPAATVADTRTREELLTAARAVAEEKGILWMREVMDAAKAKRLSEMSDEALRAMAPA